MTCSLRAVAIFSCQTSGAGRSRIQTSVITFTTLISQRDSFNTTETLTRESCKLAQC